MRVDLQGGAGGVACAMVIDDGWDAQERLDVYRNTSASVLATALQLAYPTVRRVVGDEFFEGAARLFAAGTLPHSAWLNEYGGDFPQFLAELPQGASVPYLADLARLEWKVNLVLHASDARPLDLARLASLNEAELQDLRFDPDPAAQLLRCEFPGDTIWHAVLEQDDAAMAAIDLADGPVWLLVQRVQGEVHTVRLAECEWRLGAALFAGQSLGAALTHVAGEPQPTLLAAHLGRGCYANCHVGRESP